MSNGRTSGPSGVPYWGLATGPFESRTTGVQPVYEPVHRPSDNAPLPDTRKDAQEFWHGVMCEVARSCIIINEPTPNVAPGLRHSILTPTARVVGVIQGTVAADQLFENALVFALANNLPGFFTGTPNIELVEVEVPLGRVGQLRGISIDATGDPSQVLFQVVASNGGTIIPETPVADAHIAFRELNTYQANIPEGGFVKILFRTTSTVSPVLVTGWLEVWTWHTERPGSDSVAGMVNMPGRRSAPGLGVHLGGIGR